MTAVTTNMPKRVSFGNTYTSLVETLVEDEDTTTEERRFYRDTFMTAKTTVVTTSPDDVNEEDKSLLSDHALHDIPPSKCQVEDSPLPDQSCDSTDAGPSDSHRSPEEAPPASSPNDLVPGQGTSPQSQQTKPLTPIIRLQRSPSTESHENPFTADGELSKKAEYIIKHSTISRSEIRISDPDLSRSTITEEVSKTEVTTNAAAPQAKKDKENGKVETVAPKEVEVEVATVNASQAQPQQAEQVKLKGSKCKCCVVM